VSPRVGREQAQRALDGARRRLEATERWHLAAVRIAFEAYKAADAARMDALARASAEVTALEHTLYPPALAKHPSSAGVGPWNSYDG